MKRLRVCGLIVVLLWAGVLLCAENTAPRRARVQLAILLDTSGSMSGLIDQARSQLWKIVNEFISARKNGQPPQMQVALYEYGNSGLQASENYIRMLVPLTDDLDKVSAELFKLTTNGGDEYCGAVIKAATEGLQWSESHNDYKAIFIAGNEPFTQGKVNYVDACKAAIAKGIIVNTIHCGTAQEGIAGKWPDGAALADGSYLSIDHNQQVAHISAPQDKQLVQMGQELNDTYIAYGAKGAEQQANQHAQDANAAKVAQGASVQRAINKGSALYSNGSWDLVDAYMRDPEVLKKMKDEDLPENMRKMSPEERKQFIEQRLAARNKLQTEIARVNVERTTFIANEMKKQSGGSTLDNVMAKAMRSQAAAKEFVFE